MNKFDSMVRVKQSRSEAKVNKAINCIRDMVADDQQVVVCELSRRTGLSRAFFYNNSAVREELDKAQKMQEGSSFVAKQKAVFDKVLTRENERLSNMLIRVCQENKELKDEIEHLKKEVNASAISILQEL